MSMLLPKRLTPAAYRTVFRASAATTAVKLSLSSSPTSSSLTTASTATITTSRTLPNTRIPCTLKPAFHTAAPRRCMSSKANNNINNDNDNDTIDLESLAGKIRDEKMAQLRHIKQDGSTHRFYNVVSITPEGDNGAYALRLGGIIAETPGGNQLVLPNKAYALAVQLEFENQTTYIYPHTMPLTNIALTVIDQVPTDRESMTDNIMGILQFDSVCYREDPEDNPGIARLQEKHWNPLLKWMEREFKATLNIVHGMEPAQHPRETVEIIGNMVRSLDDWTFALLESTTVLGKSVVLGLAFLRDRMTLDQAFKAIRLEESYQLQVSGRVDGIYGTSVAEEHARLRLASNRMALHLLGLKV